MWKVPVEGGTPERVFSQRCQNRAPSPDGRLMACFHDGKVAVFDLASAAMKWSYKPPSLKIPIRWTSDSRAIVIGEHRDNVSNVWLHPIDGRPAKQLTYFTWDNVWFFDLSADQKTIVSSRGNVESDAVLLTNFR